VDSDTLLGAAKLKTSSNASSKRKEACGVQVVDRFENSCHHKGPCRAIVTDSSGSLVILGFARNQLVCIDSKTGKERHVIKDPDVYMDDEMDERALHCLARMEKDCLVTGTAPSPFPASLTLLTHRAT
jgi:hypothetical protein